MQHTELCRAGRIYLLIALTLSISTEAFAIGIPPIWENAFGNALISSANAVTDTTVNLPFNFTLYGQSYSTASVSSKGYVTFGGNAGAEPDANASQFLQGIPRIAPAWYDVDVQDSGGVILYNSFSDHVVITYLDVSSYAPPPSLSVVPSNLSTYQVTLYQNGMVVFGYEAFNTLNPNLTGVPSSLLGTQQAIVGISPGYGVADPGSSNFQSSIAASPGFAFAPAATAVYQMIASGDNTNLAGLNLVFTPTSVTHWTVTELPALSVVAPEPGTASFVFLGFLTFFVIRWRSARRFDA